MKFLVVVDCQIDFVSKALANAEAEARIPRLVEKVKQREEEGYQIIFTLDSHDANYMNTLEGKKLPVPHCLMGTEGHNIVPEVFAAANGRYVMDMKSTFGDLRLPDTIWEIAGDIADRQIDEIEIIGFVSSICVAANAIILRTAFPNVPITVDASCCAGLEKEDHDAALLTLQCQQIDIINWEK